MKPQTESNISQFETWQVDERVQQQTETQLILHKNYGRLIPIMINRLTGQPQFLLGPHFYVFILTWFGAVSFIIFILKSTFTYSNHIAWTISLILCLIFLYIYVKIGFSLPGVASKTSEPDLQTRSSQKYCLPCRIVKNNGTMHCYFCDVCIYKLDHHCPWVGKCIGRDNLYLFYSFLTLIFITMASLLITVLSIGKNI